MYTAPTWVQRELRLVDPLYFAIWDDIGKCWQIRKWKSVHPINHKFSQWVQRSERVTKLPSYEDMNMAVIHSLREGLYNATRAKYILQEIDEHNARLEQSIADETEYVSRYMAKEIYRIFREPRIFLGG